MKLIIGLLLPLLFTVTLAAQQNPYWQEPSKTQAASLRRLVQETKNDSLRMYACRQLGLYYQEIKRDSSLLFYEQQLSLASRLKLKLWEAEAYSRIGYISGILGNYPRSLKSLTIARGIIRDKNTENGTWNIAHFSKEQDAHTAWSTLAASIAEHLGILYVFTGDFEKGLVHFFDCRKIAEKINDKALLSLVNMNIGEAYTGLGKLDSALLAEQQAFDYCIQSGYGKYKGFIQYQIGNIYLLKNDYVLAKAYFNESVKTSMEQQSLDFLGMGYLAVANLFLKTGNPDSAFYYAKQGLRTYRHLEDEIGLIRAYTSLSSVYQKKRNIDSAFYYQQLAIAAKDSLNSIENVRRFQSIGFDEQLKDQELESQRIQTENRIKTYAMLAGIGLFMVIAFLLYRINRNRKKANQLLQKQKEEIQVQKKNVEHTLSDLRSTQTQLIQSEKMASLGELTAGIAHEIQNPLNFVNNFSEVNKELLIEMQEQLENGNVDEVKAIANDVIANEEKINHHGKRADAIVKGMLQHSRSSSSIKEPTDLNALVDEYTRLCYHGLRAKDKSFNATIKTDFDRSIDKINIVPQDIGRVVLNLLTNAFYAVNEKALSAVATPAGLNKYEPTVSINTKKLNGRVEISIADNGNGIPQKVLDKIFQPFFTTKPTGQGTGLGLSISYDIIKAHSGDLKVDTKEGEGTSFIIQLPTQ
jgi:two-component system, NtrC family, sensor kinase